MWSDIIIGADELITRRHAISTTKFLFQIVDRHHISLRICQFDGADVTSA